MAEEENKISTIRVDKSDLKTAFEKAKEILENKDSDFKIKKAIIYSFLNKVIVYNDHIDVLVNIIPAKFSGDLPLEITKNDIKKILKFDDFYGQNDQNHEIFQDPKSDVTIEANALNNQDLDIKKSCEQVASKILFGSGCNVLNEHL